jgi:hypothetical protein
MACSCTDSFMYNLHFFPDEASREYGEKGTGEKDMDLQERSPPGVDPEEDIMRIRKQITILIFH